MNSTGLRLFIDEYLMETFVIASNTSRGIGFFSNFKTSRMPSVIWLKSLYLFPKVNLLTTLAKSEQIVLHELFLFLRDNWQTLKLFFGNLIDVLTSRDDERTFLAE